MTAVWAVLLFVAFVVAGVLVIHYRRCTGKQI